MRYGKNHTGVEFTLTQLDGKIRWLTADDEEYCQDAISMPDFDRGVEASVIAPGKSEAGISPTT